MKRIDLLAAAVLAVGGIGLAASPAFGQAADPAAQQPAAQPSGAAAQPTGAAAQPSDSSATAARDRSGSAQAGESEIRQALAQTAQAVLTQGGASNLSQQFCQKDQDRLKDLSSSASQIDQSVQQLRQAYKDKFQKDLDLSASADQIFTSDFFRQGAAGDLAHQASAQIGADQSSSSNSSGSTGAGAGASASGSTAGSNPSAGVSGTAGQSGTASGQSGGAAASGQASGTGASGSANIGGASASGSVGSSGASGTAGTSGTSGTSGAASATGDQAQTASSTAGGMQMTTVTIPESHGMPQARINLVKEGSSWKIDLPDSVDAQKLSQNLQQQLSQAATMKDKWGSDPNEAARAISHSVFIALSGDASGAGASGAAGASGTSGTSGSSGTSGTSGGTSGSSSSTPGTGTNR